MSSKVVLRTNKGKSNKASKPSNDNNSASKLLKEWSTWGMKKAKDPNEFFQKLLEDLKELAEYDNSPSKDRPIFLNDNEEHYVQNKGSLDNSSIEIATLNSNEEKDEPPQDFDIHQLIKQCSTEVSEEQKQNMESTMLELVKFCQEKELLCIHDNVEDLIESALNSKLLSINLNSQHLDDKEEEVKNVLEQPAERENCIEKSLQNFKVIHKSSISFKNTSQISSIHAFATILSTKEPEYSPSMGYENSNTTPETKSNEIMKSDSSSSDVCDNHSDIFSDSKIDDDILSDDDDFEDVEYVEASLSDPEIVNQEEENVVQQEEEEVDLDDISQIQDVDLCEKLLSITQSDNSLSDNFSPEFETFCDHTEETRSGNTTHANDSFPEYDSFCFEIDPDQERMINIVKNDIPDDSRDPLLEEADLFLTSDNSIPPGIENFVGDSEGDIRCLEELLIDDSIPFPNNESSESNFEDNSSIPRPPPEPRDAEFDAGKEIPVVMNDKDKDVDYSSFIFVIYPEMIPLLLSTESEDTIFDPGISI
nr:mitochondrial import receptor subunit TOM7-1-like [Tanacetum cinerariifolium]